MLDDNNETATDWPIVVNGAPVQCGICERPIIGSAEGPARLLLEAVTRHLQEFHTSAAGELDRFLGRGNRFRQEVLALCDQALAGDSPPFSEFGYHDALHVHLADFSEQQRVLGILRQSGYRAEESSQTSVCVFPPWRQD